MTDIFADQRERFMASLHFVPAEWLPDVAVAVAEVPAVGDLEHYRQAISEVACAVLNAKHDLHYRPCSRTLQ